MKTNKEKNLEHDARMQAKVRPKPVDYNWEDLQEAIHKMIRNNLNEQT
jgi:translation elongation factor EF-1beta